MKKPTAQLFLYHLAPIKGDYIVEQVVIAPDDDSDAAPIMIPVYVFGVIVAAESAKAARTLMASMGGISGPTSVWVDESEIYADNIGTLSDDMAVARGEHVVMRHFQAQGAA